MTSEWIVENLWRWSLHVTAVAAAVAVGIAVLRLRAPKVRLRILEQALVTCLVLTPVMSVVQGWRGRPQPPALVEVRAVGASTSVGAPAEPVAEVRWPALLASLCVGGALLRAVWLLTGLRRLRARSPIEVDPAIDAEIDALQKSLATRARIEWREDFVSPATLGAFPPRVLLPLSLAAADPARRRAIVLHELIHVRRGDWAQVLVEEAARTLFWFHPVIHWLVTELRLVREQVVDETAVELLGERKSYLDVLYSFVDAGASPTPTASAFFGRRQLDRRIRSLTAEVHMSRSHKFFAILTLTALLGVVAGVAVWKYPLDLVAFTGTPTIQEPASHPSPRTRGEGEGAAGPLERTATVADGASSVPRRLHATPFEFPAGARGVLASALVVVRVVVDETGSVGEARVLRTRAEWRPDADRSAMSRALALITDDALDTIRAWKYAAPTTALTWTMTVFYSDGPPQAAAGRETADAPAPRSSDSVRQPGALRVGGAVKAPPKLVDAPPVYPQAARDAGITGIVAIEATIDGTGSVSDARVVTSVPELDDAALDAVRQWKYEPTLLNGVPVPVIMTVTINFALRQ